MNIQEKFSEDDWYLLSSTPAMIGAAMSSAEGSGIVGTVKEMSASMRSTVNALRDYPNSELVQALLKKAENWDEAKEKISDYRTRSQERLNTDNIKSKEDLHKQVLADIEKCVSLVQTHCEADEAQIYREWSLKIANNVAKAAKEGGFMGFGGVEVSDSEKALLSKIEKALGVKSDTLLA